MDLRLFTCVLLVAIVFRPDSQNLKMDVSDMSLEIDDDNDFSWLTQSSPKKQKSDGKNQDRGNFQLLLENAKKLGESSQNKKSDFKEHVFNIGMEMQFSQSDEFLLSAVQVVEERQCSGLSANSMAHSQLLIEVCIKFLLYWKVSEI